MRYFVTFWNDKSLSGETHFKSDNFPARNATIEEIKRFVRETCQTDIEPILTNIIELSKEDYENYTK